MTCRRRRDRVLRALAAVGFVSALLAARIVHADGEPAARPPARAASAQGGSHANRRGAAERDSDVVRYTRAAAPNYVRGALEEFGLLGLGLLHYALNHDANSRDWDFDYSWPSFRRKITGDGYVFDTNLFDTNFITHPVGGLLYYLAARGNRVSVLGSFAYALVASTLWELLGEFRESASINDLMVTPVAGFVLGETTFQLGALFDRSCDSTLNRVLGSALAPTKALHDALDGLTLERDARCDDRGITARGMYEFRFGLRLGALVHAQGPAEPTRAAMQLALQTRVIALDTYGRPGEGLRTFADGNISELSASLGFADTAWNDLDLRAIVVPFGLHYRALSDTSGSAAGHEYIFGLLVGTQYSRYRYDRRNERDADRYFSLDLPGASFDYVYRGSFGRLELDLRAAATWAGVDAFALAEYTAQESEQTLTAVARSRGYNYAGGFTFEPRARLIMPHVELGLSLQATRLWAITAFDRYPEQQSHVSVLEIRRKLALWLSLAPFTSRDWHFTLLLAAAERWGAIATSERGRSDVRVVAGVEYVL